MRSFIQEPLICTPALTNLISSFPRRFDAAQRVVHCVLGTLTTLQPGILVLLKLEENLTCLSFFSQGPNALVTYTIISGADESFRIDPESGDLIATRKLDRERRSKYSLLVRADDGKQSSDTRLNITVKDVNDHSPKFSRATYSFDIPEDTAAGKSRPISAIQRLVA